MKNNMNSKLGDVGKSKDDQQAISALSTSVKETRRVAETNQLRLRQLELAIANLTTICCAIRHEMYSLGSPPSPTKQQGSFRKAQAEVIEMKRPSSTRSSSPSLDLKDDVHQLAKQAAALGILKDSKTTSIKLSGKTKADSKPPTRPIQKNVQPTNNQKTSTKQMIRSKDPTIEKKKPEIVSKYRGTSQPKAKSSPETGAGHNNIKTSASAQVSLKSSTVERTNKTTFSKVCTKQSAANKSKETTLRTVKTTLNNSYLSRTIKDHQGLKCATKCHAQTKTSPTSCAAADELKQPRKKWSTAKDITFMK